MAIRERLTQRLYSCGRDGPLRLLRLFHAIDALQRDGKSIESGGSIERIEMLIARHIVDATAWMLVCDTKPRGLAIVSPPMRQAHHAGRHRIRHFDRDDNRARCGRESPEITGGEVTGERLNGTVRPGGADWLLAAPDGYGRLDVRGTFTTDDGAHIYFQYFGLIE